MRKLLLLVGIMMVSTIAFAKGKGADITAVEAIQTVAVSSKTWTAVPSAVLGRRIAVVLDANSAVTDPFYFIITPTNVAPTNAITDGLVMQAGDPPWILSISDGVYLWSISGQSGAATKSLSVQQVKGEF